MPRYERPNQSHDYVVTKYLEIMYTAYTSSPEDLSLNPRNEWRTLVKNRELRKEGRYFNVDDSIDSDDEEYEEYCKRYLNANAPFVLYEDGAWKNRKLKEKYECKIPTIESLTSSNTHILDGFPPLALNTLSPAPVSNTIPVNIAEIAKLMLTSLIPESATTSTHNTNDTFRYRESNIIKITKKEKRERTRNIDGRRGE